MIPFNLESLIEGKKAISRYGEKWSYLYVYESPKDGKKFLMCKSDSRMTLFHFDGTYMGANMPHKDDLINMVEV